MLTLQERAAIKALGEGKDLQEILSFCSSDQGIADFCSRSKAFWLAVLPQANYELVALSLEPLKEKYWKTTMEDLAEGVHYKYYFTQNKTKIVNEQYNYLLTPAQNLRGTDNLENPYVLVPGLRLPSQTYGWILSVSILGSRDFSEAYEFALSSKDKNDRFRLASMLAIMAEKIFDEEDENRQPKDNQRAFVKEENFNLVQPLNNADFQPEWNVDAADPLTFEDYGSPDNLIFKEFIDSSFEMIMLYNGFLWESRFTMFRYPGETNDGQLFYREYLEIKCSAFRVMRP